VNLQERLASSLEAAYTIERELGGGGMARVFLATERALDRRVVIKVLSPELAAEVSAKRFEREIRLAASLQQANIVPVLSAGETDGVPHYTMPFVEGLSLADRLARDGRMAIPEAVAVLRDVARALTYAHEHGVVHRDIKPQNVLLSGEAAVVTDFGIAKALSESRRDDDGVTPGLAPTTLTGVGVSMGTPAYMASEQIAGDPAIDHRADLYSFGCLGYELLTGVPPFRATTLPGLFAAHLTEAPAPIGESRPDCPPAIAQIVMRCLEKAPDARPQTARELLGVLEGSHAPAAGLVKLGQSLTRRTRIALGLASVIVVAIAVSLVVARWRGAATPSVSMAVLPFLNVSGDSADEYLAEGIADGLTTALGKAPGVRVVSRSLSYQFRGKRGLDPRVVGRTLNARQVLQGSLRRVGGRVLVSAQLTSADDAREMWSESYDRLPSDIMAIQDDIARAIVDTLRRRFGIRAAVSASAGSGTVNRDAYDLYMRGRFLLQRRSRGVRQSIEKFEQAIVLDSNYARAHAALALALELLPYFETISAESLGTRAMASARHALSIDSSLAEAHTALAMAYQHRYQWNLADASYRRAVATGPDEVDAHIQYGRFLFYTRTIREALPHFERARALDPNSAVASGWLGHLLDLSGHDSLAMIELRHALEADSTNPPSLIMMVQAHVHSGRKREALLYAERLWNVWPSWRGAAAAEFAELGDHGRLEALLPDLEARGILLVNPGIYSALGDSTRLFKALERSTAAHTIWPTYYSLSEPTYDFVRASKRFASIVRSVGLDERIFTFPTAGRLR
jgi:serine/threonine-protein kinase